MSDQEAHTATKGYIPASKWRKEAREGVVEVPGHKPQREAIRTQPSPVSVTSRLRPADKASYEPPPFEKGAGEFVAQEAVYDV